MEQRQASGFDESPFRDVIEYYDATRFDYRVAWLDRENPAIHFGFYDQRAGRHTAALENTNRILAGLAGLKPRQRILDAGCGSGGSCLWLARHLQAQAVGITPVRSQVEEARRLAAKAGLDNHTTFLQADYCQAPFEENSFDCVWACESLCHAVEKSAFYREAFRLLRPGGQLVIAEYVRTRRPHGAGGEKLLLSWLNGWAIPDIDTPQEHLSHARAAGFEGTRIRDFTGQTWVSLKNLHKIARRWMWANYLLYGLGIRSRAQHGNIQGGIRQFEALNQGLWFYAAITARKPSAGSSAKRQPA
ncbi:MAG: methyltransferase domain-containing protein [Phaeodactylibacter sp.]|nr:methyltransferase domain-containing protein [Phaeodactylibacter sp.]